MINEELTRRVFLQGYGTVAGSVLARAGLPAIIAATQAACTARDEGAAFENITNAEAREFIAVAARIFPTTDTPGATEAGAVYFVDKAFGTFMADSLEDARSQFAEFQSGIEEAYPGAKRFSDLDETDQDTYLKLKERTQFFRGARFLTLAGVFAMASYGGNRDNVGWKLFGMDGPPHGWSYPFGYYDAEYMKEQQNGE
jgi:gluconate 2-dehydrogenase gamma chain